MKSPELLPTALDALVDELLEAVDAIHREQLAKSIRMAYALGYMVGRQYKMHSPAPHLEMVLQSDDIVPVA